MRDFFGLEDPHLLAHHQVHESAHQQFRLVLHSLDVQYRAVDQLHHHPESTIGLIGVFLEEFGLAGGKNWMSLSVTVDF